MLTARILIVEDEGIIAADLAHRLGRMGHHVTATVGTGAKALASAEADPPDVVLMDIVIQGPINGIETARRLAELRDVPVIYVTSHADDATVRSAVGTEPFGYVLKPFNERELQAAIQIALYRHRTEARLRKVERWLSATVASMGDAVIATDLEGRITLLNPEATRLTGWTADEALGRPLQDVFNVVDGRTRQPLDDLVGRALREGFNIGLDDHVMLVSRDGGTLPVDDSIGPLRDAADEVRGVVVVFRDGSERQQAEQAIANMNRELEARVLERTAQLEESNRALNVFCASVTHDLRSPLCAVSGLADILSRRYAPVLDDDGRRFLGHIVDKGAQMSRMIDDYLALARTRQVALRKRMLDTDRLVRSVVEELAAQYPHAVDIVMQPLPATFADEDLIRQVWTNLLSNALKFTSRTSAPQVQVSGALDEADARFRVQDNGAGFDPAKASQLFAMFRRLHAEADFAGNGVGLATVAAIVRKHGGSLSADGRVGQGATFQFTLPRDEALARAPADESHAS